MIVEAVASVGPKFGADGKAVHIPRMEPGLPVPPKARLRTMRCKARVPKSNC